MQFINVTGGLAGNSFAVCIETARFLKSTSTVRGYSVGGHTVHMRHSSIELAEPRRPDEYTLDQLCKISNSALTTMCISDRLVIEPTILIFPK